MKQLIKKSILITAMAVSTNALADGGYVADGAVPTIMTTAATVNAINVTMSGTNVNTANSLAILQANFGLAGNGFTNGLLTDIGGKVNAQTEAMRQLSDLQTENLFFLEGVMAVNRADEAADVINSMVDVCVTATSAQKTAQGATESEKKKKSGEQKQTARTTTTTNPIAAVSDASRINELDYCSVENNALGKCEVVSEYPNADINASTLTGGAVKMVPDGEPEIIKDKTGRVVGVNAPMKVKEGEPTKRITYDEASDKAVNLLVSNLINPYPDQTPSKEMKDDPAYHDYNAMLNARHARMSQAYNALNEFASYRSPTIDLAPQLAGLSGDSEARLTEHLKKVAVDDKISIAEMRDFQVNQRRLNNPDWYTELGGKSSKDREVEALTLQVMQMSMMIRQMELLENLNITLSTQLANDLTPLTKEAVSSMKPVSQ